MRVTILGIEFLSTFIDDLIDKVLSGGLTVVPSGPCLSNDIRRNPDYRTAVTNADIAVTDSGAMVLFWRLIRRERLIRISGLRLLEKLLSVDELKIVGKTFWVHPSEEQQANNQAWIKECGFPLCPEDHYVAPVYPAKDLVDSDLLSRLISRGPKVVIISIGGGNQERLGYWLKEQYKAAGLPLPAIVCTGAAIGFLSGNQIKIPKWADRLYLGWLFRCISNPRKFVPRYWSAISLGWILFRYGHDLPPLKIQI